MKRTFKFLLILIIMLSMVLTGCSGKEAPAQVDQDGGGEDSAETEVETEKVEADKVALVVAGGGLRRSFLYDSSMKG